MAEQWDEYLKRQQPTRTGGGGFLSSLFSGLGNMGGSSPGGGIQPNKQGLYTPSIMGQQQVGPPTPINYGAIRGLLNSGALRTGHVAPPAPMPAPAPDPVSEAPTAPHPLARLFSLFGGGFK